MDTAVAVTLMLAGDVMTGRGIDQVLVHPGAPQLFEPNVRDARDYVALAERVNGPIGAPLAGDALWGPALEAIARAAPDLRIVNLETAVTAAGQPWPDKEIHYRMHPANIGCLTAARLDCCVLANNHVLDWGQPGLRETLRTLRQAGLQVAGAGSDVVAAWAPAALPLPDGRRVLVFAMATHSSGVPAAWAAGPKHAGIALLPDLSQDRATMIANEIARCRRPGDLVVVSIHWGGNWGPGIPGAHRAFAHRLVDLGALDVLHGHSSHHPLPVEVYRGCPILYGCGDLINDYEGIGAHGSLRSDVGCIYFVTLGGGAAGGRHGGRAALQQIDVLPLQMKRLRLQAADGAARAWLCTMFDGYGARLGPTRRTALPESWSLRW